MTGLLPSGYSAQARVALDVAHLINGGRINLWFAADFNPIKNDATSNPYWIYGELDRAAKSGDRTEKALNVQANLLWWVISAYEEGVIHDSAVRVAAIREILDAFEQRRFAPLVLAVSEMAEAAKQAQPDEYCAAEVSLHDRRVMQVMPWHGAPDPALTGRTGVVAGTSA